MAIARRVLVVDDDAVLLGQLTAALENQGYEVLAASSARQALRRLANESVDVLVLDVKLPQSNGLRLLEDIRVLPGGEDVPALLMSGVYRRAQVFERDNRRLGVHAFLSKPFSLAELGRRLTKIFGLPEAGRAEVRELLRGKAARPSVDPLDEDTMRVDLGRRLPTTGTLTLEFFLTLMTTLFHSHGCGKLSVIDGDRTLTLFVLNGYPVWFDTGDMETGVLAFLAREAELSEDQTVELLAAVAEGDGGSLRSHVLRLGLVDRSALEELLEDWVREGLRLVLSKTGSFDFESGDEFAGSVPIFEVNPLACLWEALPSALDPETVERGLAELGGRAVGPTPTFGKLYGYIGQMGKLRSLGEYLSEPRTVDEVLTRFSDGDGTIARCLWFLVQTGLLGFSDSPAGTAPTAGATPSAASAGPGPSAAPPSPPVAARAGEEPESVDTEEHHVDASVGRLSALRPRGREMMALREQDQDDPEGMLSRHHQRLDYDHFRFLGVERDASSEEIEAAYQDLAPLYRVRNLGEQADEWGREAARELLTRLVEAFSELSDPARRRAYLATLPARSRGPAALRQASPVATPAKRSVRTVAAGERLRRKGSVDEAGDQASRRVEETPEGLWAPLLADPEGIKRRQGLLDEVDGRSLGAAHQAMLEGRFDDAFPDLEELRERFPSDPALLADLGWCRFNLSLGESRGESSSLEWVDLALAFDPNHLVALEVKARILCNTSRDDEALAVLRRLSRRLTNSSWLRAEIAKRDQDAEELASTRGLKRFWGRGR